MNHYELLRVPVDADDGMIRAAFRRLVRQFHPDVGAGSSTEKFRAITEAYATLIDPTRRRIYDQSFNRSARIPTHVEPVWANPEARGSRRVAVHPVYSKPPAGELMQLVDQMFRALEEDLFLNWPRFRRQ